MAKVYVPATTANIGSGFDSIGIALSMGNRVDMTEADGCFISSQSGVKVPTDDNNLIFRSAKKLYEVVGREFCGLKIVQEDNIPMARGLGSSSACIIAGMVGANALMGEPCSRYEILDIAAQIEGHPDNVAPALLGGFTASCIDGGHVFTDSHGMHGHWEFATFVPDFEFLTDTGRAVLPSTIPRSNAVYNLSRAVLSRAAFCEGRRDLVGVAVQDTLHQSYRLPHIPGGKEIFEIAEKAGGLGTFISGAGPTIISVVASHDENFWQESVQLLRKEKELKSPAARFSLKRLKADNRGVRLVP